MAYAESTIGGSSGGQFRVWVNSIRTYYGSPGENFEDWRVEGGIKRVASGGRIWNNYNAATYTIQLGMNGVATSGHFNYDYGGGTGNMNSWGTGSTRVYRNSAGVGFGFQSRTDVNLSNGPYLTSGWVTSNDNVDTRYRNATLTALSMHAGNIPATDEGPIWLEFSNPGGAAVKAFIEAPPGGGSRIYTSGNVGSRFNFPNLNGGSLTTALQQAYPNSNSGTMRIGINSSIAGYETYDYRDVGYTIKNDTGQANPVFSNFTYLDTNPTSVAVSGSDQVLIQGKSILQATVPVADKATAQKYATMSSYIFSIGGYSQSTPWSNTTDIVQDIGTVSDVVGSQTVNVRAVDSRGNGTTVSKPVTVLEYFSPGFYNNLSVNYTNDFDNSDGLVVNVFDTNVIGSIAPMTLNGTDKNAVTPTTGVQFTMAKGEGAFSTTWTNIPFTVAAGTGLVTIDPAALATTINTRMNNVEFLDPVTGVSADNTVPWYVLFKIEDKLETQYYTATIDVGRPFFRIGADGRLYYKEIEFFNTFSGQSDLYYPSLQAYSVSGAVWQRLGASGYIGGWGMLINTNTLTGGSTLGANGNEWTIDCYIPAGVYVFNIYMFGATGGAKIDFTVNGIYTLGTGFDTYNAAGNTDKTFVSSSIGVLDGATYTINGKVNGRNAANTTNYMNGLFGIKVQRVGDL